MTSYLDSPSSSSAVCLSFLENMSRGTCKTKAQDPRPVKLLCARPVMKGSSHIRAIRAQIPLRRINHFEVVGVIKGYVLKRH